MTASRYICSSSGQTSNPQSELPAHLRYRRTQFRLLQCKGFLVIRPRIGTFVADYSRDGTIETFLAITSYNGGILRCDEVRPILELRIALDTLAVELCAERITDEELAQLRAATEEIGRAKNCDDAVRHAFFFQRQLAFFSGNTFLPVIFSSFKLLTRTLWIRFCTLYGISALYENTEALCPHLEKRNFQGAVRCMKDTVQNTIQGDKPIYY